jgi:Histidine kinase-like ATPase domain
MPALRSAADVSIAITRDPALVRTVRLVAAAVARRASQDEEMVEEVRLAVGEACAVMVAGLAGPTGQTGARVLVKMRIGPRLAVRMTCPGDGTAQSDGLGHHHIDPWALLRGLVEDVTVTAGDGSVLVSMSWPL